MPFVKLSTTLPDSSIWSEPADVRIVWVTLLCMSDASGLVESTLPGIARRANVPMEAAERALKTFQEPDQFSKDPDHEGRRIERVPGGYQILTYVKHRQHDATGYERLKRYRERQKEKALASQQQNPAPAIKRKKEIPALADFEQFWTIYPRRLGKAAARKAWEKIQPDAELLQEIVEALAWQRDLPSWQKDGGQFIPHPSTWLNNRRWEDEKPSGGNGRPSLSIGAPRPEPSEPVDEVAAFLEHFPEELAPLRPDYERYYTNRTGGEELADKLLQLFAGKAEHEAKVERFLKNLAPQKRTAEIERRFRINALVGQFRIPLLSE